ncbi:MAG: flagellar biosynthetic protein FliR, partial [Deltaproteobacteria bacterium]
AAPVLGHLLVPPRVRVAIAATLAAALVPAVGAAAPFTPPADLWSLGGMLAVESAIGVLLGLVAQFIFAGVQLGGQLTGIQMGFGLANLIDPQTHAQVTIIAQWQQLMALLTFLVLDAHHLLIRALLESFRTAPPGAAGLAAAGVGAAVGLAGDVFVLGARIAAPLLIVLLLTNGALGVLARTIPQLNVFVVGFPVNVGVGLLVLGASLPFTLRLLATRFAELEPALAGLVRGLAGLAHA